MQISKSDFQNDYRFRSKSNLQSLSIKNDKKLSGKNCAGLFVAISIVFMIS